MRIDSFAPASRVADILTVTAGPSAVAAASAWVRALAGHVRLPAPDVFRLDLCVTELVTNIAEHGYPGPGEHGIELRSCPTADRAGIQVEIADTSSSFDPLSFERRAPSENAANAQIGGLGIHLIRSFADECRYERRGERNVFTVVVSRSGTRDASRGDGVATIDRGVERRRERSHYEFPLERTDGSLVVQDERSLADRRKLGFISACSVFREVPYRLLEEIVETCPTHSFADGDVLLRPGDRNHHVAIVMQGRLRVHLGAQDSPDYTEIGKGECAGEMSVIDGKPVSAYVIACGDCRLLLIDGATFLTRVLPLPEVARNLVSTLAERMRRSNDKVVASVKSSVELDALQRELRFARDVQASMVPARMTLARARPEVQCSGYMRPAREVGGDFYDAFYTEPGRLAVVMGDVCGKGMPAALFMARTLTLLRSEALHGVAGTQRQRTLQLVERTNRLLCHRNDSGYFASVFAAVLDIDTGLITWVNAGHPAPAMARGSAAFAYLGGPRNMLVGVREETPYVVGETAMPPGSVLLLYTDGVTEAESASGSMFGSTRLVDLLNRAGSRDPAVLVDSTVAAVERFVEGQSQSDDITLLALRYCPDGM